MPLPDAHISVQPDTNVGDGIRLGQAAGGALGEDNPDNGVWVPVSVLRHVDGRLDKYPHFGFDRGKPGSLIVDAFGKRFINEAAPDLVFGQAMHAQKITKAWFIGNRRFLRKYGMGLALPAPYPIGHLIRQGYLLQADTIQDLANKIGIDVMTLNVTIEEFNHHARDGKDPLFRRGENAFDASQGDAGHQPNPNLAPLEGGPYYALALYPGSISSVLGLETNANAQVLSPSGDVMPGLYAIGLDQNTVMRGTYPGGGSSIGPAMTFGYIYGGRELRSDPLDPHTDAERLNLWRRNEARPCVGHHAHDVPAKRDISMWGKPLSTTQSFLIRQLHQREYHAF